MFAISDVSVLGDLSLKAREFAVDPIRKPPVCVELRQFLPLYSL